MVGRGCRRLYRSSHRRRCGNVCAPPLTFDNRPVYKSNALSHQHRFVVQALCCTSTPQSQAVYATRYPKTTRLAIPNPCQKRIHNYRKNIVTRRRRTGIHMHQLSSFCLPPLPLLGVGGSFFWASRVPPGSACWRRTRPSVPISLGQGKHASRSYAARATRRYISNVGVPLASGPLCLRGARLGMPARGQDPGRTTATTLHGVRCAAARTVGLSGRDQRPRVPAKADLLAAPFAKSPERTQIFGGSCNYWLADDASRFETQART